MKLPILISEKELISKINIENIDEEYLAQSSVVPQINGLINAIKKDILRAKLKGMPFYRYSVIGHAQEENL